MALFIRPNTYVDQLQSCRPEILYPQLVHDTPENRNPEKIYLMQYAESCVNNHFAPRNVTK